MRLFIYSGFAEKTFLKQRKGYCDGDRCIGPARTDAAGSLFITVTAAPGAGLHVKHTTPASLEVRLRGGVLNGTDLAEKLLERSLKGRVQIFQSQQTQQSPVCGINGIYQMRTAGGFVVFRRDIAVAAPDSQAGNGIIKS